MTDYRLLVVELIKLAISKWGGARVVDWGRLLSGCRAKNSTAGSNPVFPAMRIL